MLASARAPGPEAAAWPGTRGAFSRARFRSRQSRRCIPTRCVEPRSGPGVAVTAVRRAGVDRLEASEYGLTLRGRDVTHHAALRILTSCDRSRRARRVARRRVRSGPRRPSGRRGSSPARCPTARPRRVPASPRASRRCRDHRFRRLHAPTPPRASAVRSFGLFRREQRLPVSVSFVALLAGERELRRPPRRNVGHRQEPHRLTVAVYDCHHVMVRSTKPNS
jgi:hypothetical protein